MAQVVAMILAGGQGSRLSILSEQRAKPAVPFGSNYRIIDFAMTNVMRADIRHMGIMTQYRPFSLNDHIGMGEAWGFSGRNHMAKVLPPYIGGKNSDWYLGTADAIHQNMWFADLFNAEMVLILSGDHIYSMNYSEIFKFHLQNDADVTMMTQQVPWEEAGRFGVIKYDKKGRIEAFIEKPKGEPPSNQINLGIYVFRASALKRLLLEDAEDPNSSHDFGGNIFPKMIKTMRCYAQEFPQYWRDVGTLQSFWEANMECVNPQSGLDLNKWKVFTNSLNSPAEFCRPTHITGSGRVQNSIVGKGSKIQGQVINSVLFGGVQVDKGAIVRDSVLMDGVHVGQGAQVTRMISDKWVHIGANSIIGSDETDNPVNEQFPDYLNTGLTLAGKRSHFPDNIKVGSNCLIYPKVSVQQQSRSTIPHGTTLSGNDNG